MSGIRRPESPPGMPTPPPRRTTASVRGEAPQQERTGGSIPLAGKSDRGGKDEMRHRQERTAYMGQDPHHPPDLVGYVQKRPSAGPLPRLKRDPERERRDDEGPPSHPHVEPCEACQVGRDIGRGAQHSGAIVRPGNGRWPGGTVVSRSGAPPPPRRRLRDPPPRRLRLPRPPPLRAPRPRRPPVRFSPRPTPTTGSAGSGS